jgi:plasmid stabilization system protein ParE
LDRIYDALQKLADLPGIGHRREEFTQQRLRFWPVGQYLIIYRIETDSLEIVRIVSGYRDVAALLME